MRLDAWLAMLTKMLFAFFLHILENFQCTLAGPDIVGPQLLFSHYNFEIVLG